MPSTDGVAAVSAEGAVAGGPIFDALMDFSRLGLGQIDEDTFVARVEEFVDEEPLISKEEVKEDVYAALGDDVWLYLRLKAAEAEANDQTFNLHYEASSKAA